MGGCAGWLAVGHIQVLEHVVRLGGRHPVLGECALHHHRQRVGMQLPAENNRKRRGLVEGNATPVGFVKVSVGAGIEEKTDWLAGQPVGARQGNVAVGFADLTVCLVRK